MKGPKVFLFTPFYGIYVDAIFTDFDKVAHHILFIYLLFNNIIQFKTYKITITNILQS